MGGSGGVEGRGGEASFSGIMELSPRPRLPGVGTVVGSLLVFFLVARASLAASTAFCFRIRE